MNLFLILIFTFGVSDTNRESELKCTEFKTGKFTLVDEKIGSYIIERNDSLQFESDLSSGDASKYRVTWVSDCEYQLHILDGSESLMNFYKGRTLTIKIIETYRDSYKFEAQLEGYDQVMTQVVRRIK